MSPAEIEREIKNSYPNIKGAALQLTKDAIEAEDLAHDTYQKALANTHQFKPGTNFQGWVYTILRNTFINKYRSEQVRRKWMANDGYKRASFSHEDAEHNLPPDAERPTHTLPQYIKDALEQVPENFRTAVILCDLNDCDYNEIAARMGTPKGTVMSRISRGRKLLREMLYAEAVELGVVVEK